MAAYYLQMQPHLFREAVSTAFERIKEQRQADAAAASAQGPAPSSPCPLYTSDAADE